MKHYDCCQTITYDVIFFMHHFQGERNELTILTFLILRGIGFDMHIIIISSHVIRR